MDAAADPRWNKPAGQAEAVARRVPARDNSFKGGPDAGAYSIVFSADWVRITTPIGEGAFSRVYEGVYTNPDTLQQSVVAVKILKRDMLKRRSDCLRFIKEAKIMTKINHKCIAACFGIGKYEDDNEANPGSLFIVQELIKGGNLLHKVYKQMLNRHKQIYTSQTALTWMLNVAEGMQYLHSVTETKPMIIHRDLKLENIMLGFDGTSSCKLVDFGLHKVIDNRLQKVVKRVASEAVLGGGRGRLGGPVRRANLEGSDVDEDDELEVALAEQRAKMAVGGGARAQQEVISPSSSSPSPAASASSRLSRSHSSKIRLMPTQEEAIEEEDEEAGVKEEVKKPAPSRLVQSSGTESPPILKESPADPRVKLRRAPQRTTSMQKLMAKMKEIKLKVVGRMGETSTVEEASEVSATAASTSSANSATTTEAAAADPKPAASAKDEKMARNHQLLDKYIAQQSTSQNDTAVALDDLGIIDTGRTRRAPPRRAVTWVNEISGTGE
eukprot:gene12533-15749_t